MLAVFFPGHIIAPVIISFFCFPFNLFGVRVSECFFFATMPMLLLNFIKFTWIIAFYALYMADGTEDVTHTKKSVAVKKIMLNAVSHRIER